MKFPTALVITGPTAVGKSAVALALARLFPVEIISADSRQIYRHMDIGTAKPSPAQRREVPHHFIDIRDPDELYSAGEFGRESRAVVKQVMARDQLAVIVGGSGLYVRALLEGFSEALPSNRALRAALKRRAEQEGGAALHAELAAVDPATAARLPANDLHRIVRALEVYHASRQTLSTLWCTPPVPAPFAYRAFCLNLEREILHQRINQRVHEMVAAGLVEECRHLLALGYDPQQNALQTVGYQEVFDLLAGRIDHKSMVSLIQRHTRQYAKRQLTWLRKMRGCGWLQLEAITTAGEVAARLATAVTG